MKTQKMTCGRYLHMATSTRVKQMIACCALTATLFGGSLAAQNPQTPATRTSDTIRTLEEVIIQDVRVSNKTPLTTSTLDRKALDDARVAVSIPYQLETQTSVVATGENAAIGGTYIRIRGVEPSRINVNLNGITLNDPESQQVFWYNIPNLGGMSQSMQIQRGLGASTGGSSSFGAAINMQTLNSRDRAYGEADMSYGSWNTRQYGLSVGTGIMKSGLSFDFAYSGLTSDGYVRSWGTDQQSFFGSASWYGESTLVKLIAILGKQKTGIAWNGAYDWQLDEDPTYNSAGEYDMDGKTMYYPNETDNYWQRHYQLYISHLFNDKWSIKGAFDFMRGGGYYEQYMTAFSGYVPEPFAYLSDVVFQKRMDNNTYTANAAINYSGEKMTFSVGDNFIFYDGKQWGDVIWVRDTSMHYDMPYRWYDNKSAKYDNSVYAKATYDFTDDFNAYADLQLRLVDYRIWGGGDDVFAGDFDIKRTYLFLNPKLGVNYRLGNHQRTYFVAGISQREPVRFDIMSAYANGDTIKAETMLDLELGYQMAYERWAFNANLYAMLYKDQMTPNGDVLTGYALMENVDKSYRLGIELEGGYKFCDWFRMDANVTLSLNKIVDYSFYDFAEGDSINRSITAEGDTVWSEMASRHLVTQTTDLSLSPSVVGAAIATFSPVKDAKLQLVGKYVGKQYADNTSRECYAIDPYFLLNFKASYVWHLKGTNEIEAQVVVNNLLNHKYRLHAWAGDCAVDADDWGDPARYTYGHARTWLQQPGINFMGRLIYRF